MRIHFGLEDLTRVRLVENDSPVLESIFALQMLSSPSSRLFEDWRRNVESAAGHRMSAINDLLRRYRPVPHLLWLAGQDVPPDRNVIGDESTRRHVSSLVFDFCRLAVMPYWSPLRRHLQRERDARSRHVAQAGVDALLRTLHPRASWEPPVLTVPDGQDRDVHLGGRGLAVQMSLFLGNVQCLLLNPNGTQSPTLVVPAPVAPEIASVLRAPSADQEQALGALVGHTRAAALEVMATGCTTGELSDRLGISLAGASKHATILRNAGLVMTVRNGNTGLHLLTSLGKALLDSHPTVAG